MVARAGKSVGWVGVGAPVCCLRHDLLCPCAQGLRELAMELHRLGATSPPNSQNKRPNPFGQAFNKDSSSNGYGTTTFSSSYHKTIRASSRTHSDHSLCARHSSKHFTRINSFHPLKACDSGSPNFTARGKSLKMPVPRSHPKAIPIFAGRSRHHCF